MIVLVAAPLAILVIYAGLKLLIQTKKEMLGNFYRYASWFFIISGFFILVCAGACCIVMCCKYGSKMMHKEHKMKRHYEGRYMEDDRSHKGMMKSCHCDRDMDRKVVANCGCGERLKCCDYNEVCKMDTMTYKK
jgi:hypothetical protein